MTRSFDTLPHPLLAPVIELVRLAGEMTLPFWRANVTVTAKADDSPVTAADLAAHQVLAEGLQALDPTIHVLSEEDADIPFAERARWERWWLVDPLDGTKEFISGSEEFTVNVALIERGRVVFGVVCTPTDNRCWFGGAGLGAWRSDDGQQHTPVAVRVEPGEGQAFTVVASRRHSSPEQERLLNGLAAAGLGPLQMTNIGSSLKFCLLAEGAADCYPRLAPTSQWDTAAAQGVLEGAGGAVLQLDGQPFSYPARESLLNPFFLALPASAPWREKLLELAQA